MKTLLDTMLHEPIMFMDGEDARPMSDIDKDLIMALVKAHTVTILGPVYLETSFEESEGIG